MLPRVHLIPGDTSAVISAPHGHDQGTAALVHEACRQTGLAGICCGYGSDPRTGEWLNVNRPTQGAGLEFWEEELTDESVAAYLLYRRELDRLLGGGPLLTYVEVHDNDTQLNAELALLGVPVEMLRELKAAWTGPMPLLVEGIDEVRMKALPSKVMGTLPDARWALHLELPADEWKREPAATLRSLVRLVSAVRD